MCLRTTSPNIECKRNNDTMKGFKKKVHVVLYWRIFFQLSFTYTNIIQSKSPGESSPTTQQDYYNQQYGTLFHSYFLSN